MPGAAVEISAKGSELWVINAAQNIYRWNGSNWKIMPGAAVRAAASPDGWTWVVNSVDHIYRWNVINSVWDRMPGLLVQISAISKDRGNFSETEIFYETFYESLFKRWALIATTKFISGKIILGRDCLALLLGPLLAKMMNVG